jgi:hypothetical protein
LADVVLSITISGLATIFSVALGSYALLKDPKKALNEAFALWCFSVSVITVGDSLRTYAGGILLDPQLALFWSRFTVFGAILFVPTFLGFIFALPPKTEGWKVVWYSSLLWAASFFLLLQTDYLVSGVLRFPPPYGIRFGPAILAFVPFFSLFLIVGMVVLVRKVRRAGTMARRLLIFLGIIAALTGLTTLVPPIQDFSYNPSPIGILSLTAVGVLGNFVLKHQSFIRSMERRDAAIPPPLIPELGSSYLLLEDRPDGGFRVFSDLVKNDYYGLIFSRVHPDKIRQEYGLTKIPSFWLSSDQGENVVSPSELFRIPHHTRTFSESVDKGVVLVEGLEYLVTNASFENVLKMVQDLNDAVARSKVCLIITLNRLSLRPQELNLLKSEIRHIVE